MPKKSVTVRSKFSCDASKGPAVLQQIACGLTLVQQVVVCVLYFRTCIPSQVTVETPSRPAPFHTQLDSSLTRVGRALAGGDLQAIAKAVFNSDGLREQLLQRFTDTLNNEVTELCRKRADPPSLLRRIPIEKVPDFKWCDCIAELKSKAPILLQVLSALVSSNDNRNKQKRGDVHHPGVCMAIAILLKERNREMCEIQTLISLVLFTSRVQKQVHMNIYLV